MTGERIVKNLNESQVGRLLRILAIGVWIATPLVLLFWPFLSAAEPFGKETQDLLARRCVQASFVVSCFFLSASVIFADLLSSNRMGRLTAFLASAVLIHFAIANWCWYQPNLYANDQPTSFLYIWMITSFLMGLFVWWRIRRAEIDDSANGGPMSQFSIGAILTWLTLTGMLISLFTQSDSLPVIPDWTAITDSLDQTICLVALPLLAWPLTCWLIRTRHFFLVGAGVWVILFAACWIVYCLIGLNETDYYRGDAWFTKIATFTVSVVLYLAWMGIASFGIRSSSFRRNPRQPRWLLMRRISLATFSIVSTGLWIFLGVWLISNFVTFDGNRSLSHFDSSPVIMRALEKDYGAEAIERVRAKHNPQSLAEWINGLGRDRVPKESNYQYQIASLTKFPFLDREEAEGRYRKLMGFTDNEIASLADHTIESWLQANRSDSEIAATIIFDDEQSDPNRISPFDFRMQIRYAPWDNESMPLAAKFCSEKQAVFRRLRQIISEFDEYFEPITEDGYLSITDVTDFSTEMILADARYALSKNDLSGAFENLDSLAELAGNMTYDDTLGYKKPRIQARVMDVLLHVLETRDLDEVNLAAIRDLAKKVNLGNKSLKQKDANRFARLMLQHRTNMGVSVLDRNFLLLWGQRPTANLISIAPQAINWNEYIVACKEKFDQFQKWKSEADDDSRMSELFEIATVERKTEWQFHEHAMNLFDFPASRSKRIAETLTDVSQQDLRLHVLFALRAKLRRVALELLLFRAEYGEFPDSLKDLDCNATDPFSNDLLRYRKTENRFDLYSVGSNGIDDGGIDGQLDWLFCWPEANMKEYIESD